MILIIGGLGFIGANTAEAILHMGESCILTQHVNAHIPSFLQPHLGKSIFIEKMDIVDRDSIMAIGKKYSISHIVLLAGGGFIPETANIIDIVRIDVLKFLNFLEIAHTWPVKRIIIASTIGIYGGVTTVPLKEDSLVTIAADHPIPVVKKIYELAGGLVASRTGLQIVFARITGIWGPLGRPRSVFFSLPQLVHAVVRDSNGVKEEVGKLFADEGGDFCYVKDCGRALAMLTMTQKLQYTVYNVGSGRLTTNREIIEALHRIYPEIRWELCSGRGRQIQDVYLDIARLREDTGFHPEYDIDTGIVDYAAWLRAGNER
jgi:UDP-glucose 4-epimerase